MTAKILYEDSNTLVVEKPQGMSVQKDTSRNKDLLSEIGFMLKLQGKLSLDQSLHLINRLDRPVGGLVLMAKSPDAARHYSNLMKENALEKHYLCVVKGVTESDNQTLTDYLIKDDRENRSSITDSISGKKSILEYHLLQSTNALSLLDVHLITGRHHQIRVQLSHVGLPIWGDAKYNQAPSNNSPIALWAHRLTFTPYRSKESITVLSWPKINQEPWNIFAIQ